MVLGQSYPPPIAQAVEPKSRTSMKEINLSHTLKHRFKGCIWLVGGWLDRLSL